MGQIFEHATAVAEPAIGGHLQTGHSAREPKNDTAWAQILAEGTLIAKHKGHADGSNIVDGEADQDRGHTAGVHCARSAAGMMLQNEHRSRRKSKAEHESEKGCQLPPSGATAGTVLGRQQLENHGAPAAPSA
jgi:hypothetical protein